MCCTLHNLYVLHSSYFLMSESNNSVNTPCQCSQHCIHMLCVALLDEWLIVFTLNHIDNNRRDWWQTLMQAKRSVFGLVNFQRRSLVFYLVRQQRFDFVTLCKVKRVFWIQRFGFQIPHFISAFFSGFYTNANCRNSQLEYTYCAHSKSLTNA